MTALDHLARDVRYGWRGLRKNPAFAAMAVLTMGLGIGANTAVFSVVNSVLLRPLPYAAPGQLVRVYETNKTVPDSREPVRAPNVVDWMVQARSFSAMAALRWQSFTLTGGTTPELLQSQRVSAGMLRLLGVQPAIGRDFSHDDEVLGRDRVVLLSDEFWRTRFLADASILGKTVQLDFETYTIIGVLPPGFRAPSPSGSGQRAGLLLPLTFTSAELEGKGFNNNQVYARLRAGATRAAAQAEMIQLAAGLEGKHSFNKGRGAAVIPLLDTFTGNQRAALQMIFAAAGFVLLIACANLANALLARGAGQHREIAVRLALGASRLDIVYQLLTQNALLATLGCGAGLLAANWVLEAIRVLAPANFERLRDARMDAATFAFALAAAVFTALAAGLLPAFRLSSLRPGDALKTRGPDRGPKMFTLGNSLIVAQVAFSIVLLTGAALFLKSFAKLRGVDVGFETGHTLALGIPLPKTKYPEATRRLQFYSELAARLEQLPGVEAVGYTSGLPLRGIWYGTCTVENPEVAMGSNDVAYFQLASPDYFRALDIRLHLGRTFVTADHAASQPVAILNRAFARRYWPTSDPLGRLVSPGKLAPFTVVGVVDDVHLTGPAQSVPPQIYFATGQAPLFAVSISELVARTAGDPRHLASQIQREVWALDKDLPITTLRTMEEELVRSTAGSRFTTLLISSFAGLALFLAGLGIYGAISYWVAQQLPEIGIRIAIGASRVDILALILRQAGALVALGALVGTGASLAASRLISGMLFQVAPQDPAAFAGALFVLMAAGLLAALAPAWRAIRVDPICVLRAD